MTGLDNIAVVLGRFVPLLVTILISIAILMFLNRTMRRRWAKNPDAQFRFQLIMLALTFAGLLAVLIALPIEDEIRGQLLSLIGILLTAAIALASTTFIGNIMAGVMLTENITIASAPEEADVLAVSLASNRAKTLPVICMTSCKIPRTTKIPTKRMINVDMA